MTSTNQANETVVAVTPSPPESVPKPPSIKRHLQLYRYGKLGLLGRKAWKEGNVIIYDDSTFKIFKDAEGHKTSIKPIKLEDVVLELAFGKATYKYGPPPIVGDEQNYIASTNYIAIPETTDRNKIHWFAAKDEHSLNEIMQVIAETVAGKAKPPQLGKGPKGRYLSQDEKEKWVTYWQAQQHAAEAPSEENGEQKVTSVAQPPVAKPVATPAPPPSADAVHGKQQPQGAVVEMPRAVGTLRLQPDYNLRDETNSDTVPVVHLVKGRRVKEDVVRKPTDLPPKPSPFHIHHQGYKTGSHISGVDQHAPTPKYEISTFVVKEPENAAITVAVTSPAKEHFTAHQEREEIVTEGQKTVINVGSSERAVSTVDNSDNGVTYTSTKQSSFHRSEVTTSQE